MLHCSQLASIWQQGSSRSVVLQPVGCSSAANWQHGSTQCSCCAAFRWLCITSAYVCSVGTKLILKMCFVRVEYLKKKEMVPIEDVENLSFEDFVKSGNCFYVLIVFKCIVWFVSFSLLVAQTFQAQFSDGFGELKICDQLETPIKDLSTLKYAINVWAKSGCFYLKVDFQQETSESITSAVTPV